MKKKLIVCALCSVLSVGGVVALTSLRPSNLKDSVIRAEDLKFELLLDSSNAPQGDYESHQIVKPNGATFEVTYTDCTPLANGHVSIAAGGSVIINTKLGGLKSAKATYTGKLTAIVGVDEADFHEAEIGPEEAEFFTGFKFNYVQLVAETDVELTSVSFFYSCEQEFDDQDLPTTDAGIVTVNDIIGAKASIPNRAFLGDQPTIAIYPTLDNEVTSVKLNGEDVTPEINDQGFYELSYYVNPNDELIVETSATSYQSTTVLYHVINPETGEIIENVDVRMGVFSAMDDYTVQVEAPLSITYEGEEYYPVKKYAKAPRGKTAPAFNFYFAKKDTMEVSTTASASLSGTGTAADPYLIKSAADFLYLKSNLSESSGKYYKLTKLIDLNSISGLNFDAATAGFAGTFDGSNAGFINFNGTEGLFGFLGDGATIKNLVVDANVAGADAYSGIVASRSTKATFDNVFTYGELTSTTAKVGALLGSNDTGTITVNNCVNLASVTATHETNGANRNGGFVGYTNSITMTDSTNYANVTGKSCCGGLIGEFGKGVSNVTRATNFGSVNDTYSTVNALGGGIAGGANVAAANISFYDCENYGNVSVDSVSNYHKFAAGKAGGIFGGNLTAGDNILLSGCKNFGDVQSIQICGGIMGNYSAKNEYKLEINDCVNIGNVSPKENAANANKRDSFGGGLGYIASADGTTNNSVSIYNFVNLGDVTGSRYLGGVVGVELNKQTSLSIQLSSNYGDITATFENFVEGDTYIGYTGGMIGWCRSTTSDTFNTVFNYGVITVQGKYGGVGGIFGMTGGTTNVTVNIAVNYGLVIAGGNGVGGIIGGTTTATDTTLVLTNCTNVGRVSGNNNIGGIIGNVAAVDFVNFDMTSCENMGKVNGHSCVGDLIGHDARAS